MPPIIAHVAANTQVRTSLTAPNCFSRRNDRAMVNFLLMVAQNDSLSVGLRKDSEVDFSLNEGVNIIQKLKDKFLCN